MPEHERIEIQNGAEDILQAGKDAHFLIKELGVRLQERDEVIKRLRERLKTYEVIKE